MNAQQMQQALALHHQVRRSTELPLFYGVKSKDSITALNLITRINTAAEIANWNDARKIQELYMILRDRALVAFESLGDLGIDKANWNAVKDWFLATYETKYTKTAS